MSAPPCLRPVFARRTFRHAAYQQRVLEDWPLDRGGRRSRLRIVGGAWADTDLVSPGGRVRPTEESVRVACMDLITTDLHDARVLDLFAGTGAVGLEMLSRGAASCDFVEDSPSALHALKANVAKFRLRHRARVFKKDAIPFAAGLVPCAYDIAYVDPPWGSGKLDRILACWRATSFARVLVVEHDPELRTGLRGRTRRVGSAALTLVHAPAPQAAQNQDRGDSSEGCAGRADRRPPARP